MGGSDCATSAGVRCGGRRSGIATSIRSILTSVQARFAQSGVHDARVDTAAEPAAEPLLVAAALDRVADFRKFELPCQASARQFKHFLPRVPLPSAMAPVVTLHGCKQSPDDFAAGTRMNERALRDSSVVAYPAEATLNNVAQ
jgi:poly(3-hydroxybutyrate) depolymerase